MLHAQSILQGHYKTTARSTERNAINGEVAIYSLDPDASQRANVQI